MTTETEKKDRSKFSVPLQTKSTMNNDANNSTRDVPEQVFLKLLPTLIQRTFVLRRLLASADLADSMAPNAWAVSLFKNGFRLNVGQVEVLIFIDGELRVNLIGATGIAPFVGPKFEVASYQSVTHPHCAFVGSVEDFIVIEPSVRSSHEQFVQCAARTKFDQPRKGTPFRRNHSEQLVDYARSATAEAEKYFATPLANLTLPSMDHNFDLDSARAIEGYELDRKVLARGRNADLATMRKERDHFTCQACHFKLQLADKFVIEVHHLQPLSASGEIKTSIEQLISLCPTCHRIAHLRSTPYSVKEIREILERSSSRSGTTQPCQPKPTPSSPPPSATAASPGVSAG